MKATPIQLVAPQTISALAQAYKASKITRIDKATFTNRSGGAATVSIYVVPASKPISFPDSSYAVTIAASIADGATLSNTDLVWHNLNIGDSIWLESDAFLYAYISGVTFE